jgi:hypothetical protein
MLQVGATGIEEEEEEEEEKEITRLLLWKPLRKFNSPSTVV